MSAPATPPHDDVPARVEHLWRTESRRVLATLVRLLGDLDVAEEALQNAFAAALERWPREGVPERPRPWLVSAGRFRAIDALRRRARFDATMRTIFERLGPDALAVTPELADDETMDDRLRLVFLCCHPSLAEDAQAALTLREVCGLTTEEIARAFLVAPSTLAQRIVRAKARLRDAAVTFELPPAGELPARLAGVQRVVYLVFNEGYSASSGDAATRVDLSSEAIRLGRLLVELLPDAESQGLLALMLLHESRRAARTTPAGDLVLLQDQDRALWDLELAAEGAALTETALRSRRFGPYTLQAAIAAVHAEAPDAARTDWEQIVGLYDVLLRADPGPVVALNHAVAVGMRDGPAAGLALIDALLADGVELDAYVPAHAAHGDLCLRAGRFDDARRSFERALALSNQEPERRLLRRRLDEIAARHTGPRHTGPGPDRRVGSVTSYQAPAARSQSQSSGDNDAPDAGRR